MSRAFEEVLLDVFGTGGLYSRAIGEVIEMETVLGGVSKQMAIELRDALDHLANLYSCPDNDGAFGKHAADLKTHLYRCLNESAEYRAEESVMLLRQKLGWGRICWFLCFIEPRISFAAMRRSLNEAMELIAEGRKRKADRDEPYEKFSQARKRCEDCLDALHQEGETTKRLALFIAILTVVITVSITIGGWLF